jgi:hypothetical protein
LPARGALSPFPGPPGQLSPALWYRSPGRPSSSGPLRSSSPGSHARARGPPRRESGRRPPARGPCAVARGIDRRRPFALVRGPRAVRPGARARGPRPVVNSGSVTCCRRRRPVYVIRARDRRPVYVIRCPRSAGRGSPAGAGARPLYVIFRRSPVLGPWSVALGPRGIFPSVIKRLPGPGVQKTRRLFACGC